MMRFAAMEEEIMRKCLSQVVVEILTKRTKGIELSKVGDGGHPVAYI